MRANTTQHPLDMIRKNDTPLDCEHCKVRSKSIFCDLHHQDMEAFTNAKACMTYKRGQTIFREGGFPHGLYCINSGKVKIYQLGDEGKEQIVRLAREGDVLGYRALLSVDRYNATAEPLEDTDVCFIPKEILFKLIETNSSFTLQVMKLLSNDLKNAEHKITQLAQKPVRERVAESLLFLKETYGLEADEQTINVTLSREELANIVGTATETAIRLLSEFKHDHIIELIGKKIRILDLHKLVQTANVFD